MLRILTRCSYEMDRVVENCIYCASVGVMYKIKSDLIIHNVCIGLYTELIGWHCLGAESYLIRRIWNGCQGCLVVYGWIGYQECLVQYGWIGCQGCLVEYGYGTVLMVEC